MFKIFSTITFFGLLVTPAIHAQDQYIQARVPFAFTLRRANLPAGTYQITYNSLSSVLYLRGSKQPSEAAFAIASALAPAGDEAKLVFHCYSGSCRLAEFSPGHNFGGSILRLVGSESGHNVAFLTRVVSIANSAK
jgi:hypothetical protein